MYLNNIIKKSHVILTRCFAISVIILFNAFTFRIFAQQEPSYDEISVFLNVPRLGGGDIDAVIVGEELYLPVTELFDFLKIRNVPDPDLESVTGFFIDPKAVYDISRTENKIVYQGNTFTLEPNDIIRTEFNLYLKSSYFGKVFGLDCTFDFRSLSVTLNSKLELPLIREMKREEMRKNLKRLKGDVIADTTIGRTYPAFKFGMADWAVNSSQEIKGKSSTVLNLGLGAMVAGGEASTSLYYNTDTSFLMKYQQYLWRYVNNDFSPLRQISVGRITTNAISSIYNPVVGIKLTNTPTTYRRSFGSYTLSDYTEPNWIVELYINNVLVDYVKADASGFFTFEVPLVYGNTTVNLKFIGPWGEERTKEQNFVVPFTFLPVNKLEYTVNAGMVQDTSNSMFSRASINYGLSRSITIGGGAEYLSSIAERPAMPYLNTSLKITNNLLLTSEYTYYVRSKSTMTYRLPSNMQLDINYTWYHKDQKAINYNYREERKVTLSTPLHIGKLKTYQRFSVNQIVMPTSKYTTGEWLSSGSIFNINTNLTTYALFISGISPNVYSNLSLSFRLPANITCMPQMQYGYNQQKILTAKLALQKHILKNAYLDLTYEHNTASKNNMAQLQFRYDFSFAQAGFTATRSNKKTTLSQYARGSFINDRKTRYLHADNRTNVGKGGISIIPYLDLNSNGKRDAGEPKAAGLNIRANGGRIEKSDCDTTIRILGLEPYTSCFIELDPNSFENISWKLHVKTLSVVVDPNILKLVEVPIIVAGEASGTVSLEKNGEKNGIGRIIVGFTRSDNKPSGKVLTEADGYFTYLGLLPGKYSAKVDTAQLRKLKMTSEPEYIDFNVAPGVDGDIIEGLDFILKKIPEDTTTSAPVISKKPVVKRDTSVMIVHEISRELVTISEDSYAIQLGAFVKKQNAEVMRRKIEKLIGGTVEIISEEGFYKVRITGIKTRGEADDKIEVLRKNGITEVWLISLKAKKQQLVISQKQDTITSITETRINEPVEGSVEPSVQIASFRLKSSAIAFKEKMSRKTGKTIEIVYSKGMYNVRILGLTLVKKTVIDEIERITPSTKLKLKDSWTIPIITVPVEELPEEVPPVEELHVEETPLAVRPIIILPEKAENPIVFPLLATPVSKSRLVERNLDYFIIGVQPAVSLQVALVHKRSQALRAQRTITSKLKLQVVVEKQWDYYRVIVKGFHNREETYKYYPELAAIGYPVMFIIDTR